MLKKRSKSIVVLRFAFIIDGATGERRSIRITSLLKSRIEKFVWLIDGKRATPCDYEGNPVGTEQASEFWKFLTDCQVVVADPDDESNLLILNITTSYSLFNPERVETLDYYDRQSRRHKSVRYFEQESHVRNDRRDRYVLFYNNQKYTKAYVNRRIVFTKLRPDEYVSTDAQSKLGYSIYNANEMPF